MSKDCENLNHDFENLKRYGRADWRCPLCGENVMLLLVYAEQAGVDLTKTKKTKGSKSTPPTKSRI